MVRRGSTVRVRQAGLEMDDSLSVIRNRRRCQGITGAHEGAVWHPSTGAVVMEPCGRIEQLQQKRTRISSRTGQTSSRASEESLRRRLTLAHHRLAQLRTENQQLRDELARAHGEP